MESLILDASGREQVPTKAKPVLPAQQQNPEGGGGGGGSGGVGGQPPGGGGVPKGGGGDGQEKGAKGGGKAGGKGRGAGKRAGGGDAGKQGVDSDHESVHSSATQVNHARPCIKNIFGKCPYPADQCPKGGHWIPNPIPDGLRNNAFFQKLLKEHGEPKAAES